MMPAERAGSPSSARMGSEPACFRASDFALSTRWNVRRHTDGSALVDEILAAGFRALELSYDLTRDLVPGLLARVRGGAVRVVSVHNYCPVPMGVARGSPEIFLLAAPDADLRRRAVEHTASTLRFAAEVGARAVVAHGGYVRHWWPLVPRLMQRLASEPDSASVERLRLRIEGRREKKAPRYLDALRRAIEALAPTLRETRVTLAFENLPSWEAVPSEAECRDLIEEFRGLPLGYWHDIGHGHIREWCGFINHERLFARMLPHTVGIHVHDVQFPARDHCLPPGGLVDFTRFAAAAAHPAPKVIEPGRDATAEELRRAAEHVASCWRERPAPPS